MNIALVVAIATVLLFSSAETGGLRTAPSEEADRILREVLDEDGVPSISVAIATGGTLVYSRAFGFADLEQQTRATTDTRYAIGSIAKSITAAGALQLAQLGRLDLDAPVQKYCEAFPTKAMPVTVRQLLGHTGGVRHYDYRRFDEDFLNKQHFESINAALTKFAADPLVAVPGEKYHYSSWGYVLIGCAIEGASSGAYADFIRSRIIQPAKMAHTGLDVVSEIIPHRARGYSRNDAGTLENAIMFDSSDRYPAGGLLSTPGDLVAFAHALLDGELLDKEYRGQLWTPARLVSGETTGRGLGWDISPDGKEVYHGGTTVGTTTFLYVRPHQRVVVAIALNLSRWSGHRLALAATLADLWKPRILGSE